MYTNKIKSIWAENKTAVNGWLNIPSSWSAEMMAHQGYDSLVVDMQHGMMSYETAVTMIQAINTTHVVPLARPSWNEPGQIGRLLDAGAMGIVCPMINHREDCEKFVAACRYFPDGYRSLGPTRPRVSVGPDYSKHANREIITMAMIETAAAVEQAEEIISVPGLDAVYIGPGDLSLTMGLSQRVDNTDPIYLEALDHIAALCQKHGVVAGLHTASSAYARQMHQKGFQFVTLWTDSAILGAKAKEMVSTFHDSGATTAVVNSAY